MEPHDVLSKEDRTETINVMFQDWCDADLNITKSTVYENDDGRWPSLREYQCTKCGRVIKVTSLGPDD